MRFKDNPPAWIFAALFLLVMFFNWKNSKDLNQACSAVDEIQMHEAKYRLLLPGFANNEDLNYEWRKLRDACKRVGEDIRGG